jgi:hypothetical protein
MLGIQSIFNLQPQIVQEELIGVMHILISKVVVVKILELDMIAICLILF